VSWRLVLTLALLGVGGAGCARLLWTRYAAEQAKQREAGYEQALRSYSDLLKPGMTRKQVESYLRASGASFRHQCCMEQPSGGAWDDLVKIGSERPPWYCGEHNVYIGFAFSSADPHSMPQANDSDTLRRVQIFHGLESCL
jgi:hypothetical protein